MPRLVILWIVGGMISVCWANSPPKVSGVTAFQRTDESGIVDINYVLEDADGDPCLITVVISADGGSTWTITPSSEVLSGDVGSGVKPGRNQIVWASRIDLPGAKGTQYMALVTADDGDGGSYSLPASMVFVAISDPGVSGHDGFSGQMSVNETTNAEYCQYLNAAMAERLITVHNNVVYAANDTSYTEPYLATHAADSGSQITYSGGTFRVHTRDGRNMARHPVVQVSWYGATAFCHFYSVRLPTEWEWQAVADYDGSYTYGCGSTISQSRANYRDSVYANPLGLSDTPYTSPVGHFSAFGYGLCDIAGNAWEWTDSVYSKSHRVVRGGSWRYYDTYCAVWRRNGSSPHSTNNIIGFRVCRGTGSVLAGFHSSQSTLFALSNGNGGPSPSEPAIYVDDDSSSDPGPNNPLVSDPQEDGSANHPFDTVQEAIDAAPFGATVRVLPGHYVGRLNLLGKSITVTSLVDIDSEEPNSLGAIDQTILDGNGSGPVVTFASHEGTACVLQGFTITGGVADAGGGILCDNSAPMISHCLITGNQATRFTGGGVDCYGSTAKFINCSIVGNDAARGGGGVSSDRGADLFINCIIWGNTPDAVLAAEEGVSLTFCSVEGSWMGGGNLDLDPQFVVTGFWALPETMDVPVLPDTEGAVWIAGDYHLESRAGHYDVDTAAWMKDAVSSPCIDAGDPNMSYEREPDPNGARINMGAYGGTMEASKARPELALLYDFNLDTNPVWTTQGQWQFGYPMGQGGANGHSDPASGFSGQNVYGVNLAGDYDLTEGGPYSLTAGPFDCRDQSHVALRFARWLNSDAVRFVRHRIEVSNNGTAWQVIWEAPRELDEVTDSAWQIQEYDISDVADQQVAVWVRWTYEVLDRALAYSGWNIDDIQIYSQVNSQTRTVDWIESATQPIGWSIAPTQPGSDDTISFWGPTDPYANPCVAEATLGGTPKIDLDFSSHTATLWFQSPAPAYCPLFWHPVSGLEGEFGPLSAGQWTFRCLHPEIAFNLAFVVSDADSGPPWEIVGATAITMTIPSPPLTTPITVSGSSSYTFINDAALEYKIEITGIPAVGGTWTADPSIGTLPSGENTVNFTLQGVNVDISSMPAGMQMIAEIVFHAKPQNGTGN